MKLHLLAALTVAILLIPTFTQAQSTLFGPLKYGMVSNAQVVLLQNFLIREGFFAEQPTGNFFLRTQDALMKFQQSAGIEATGYFGPLTQAAANKIISNRSKAQSPNDTVSKTIIKATSLTRKNTNQSASLINALWPEDISLTWETNNYPIGVGINIQLLRKISTSPVQYEFVRTIATNTPNDSVHSWKPPTNENYTDLYIEITCSDLYKFIYGCNVGGEPLPL